MASKRRIRNRECTSKEKYESSSEGLTAIYHVKRRTGDTSKFNVYRCKFCKKYHIGHAPGSSRFI